MMYMSRKRDEWMKRGVCMDKTTERANEGGKERQESKKTIDQSNEKNSKHSIFFPTTISNAHARVTNQELYAYRIPAVAFCSARFTPS